MYLQTWRLKEHQILEMSGYWACSKQFLFNCKKIFSDRNQESSVPLASIPSAEAVRTHWGGHQSSPAWIVCATKQLARMDVRHTP